MDERPHLPSALRRTADAQDDVLTTAQLRAGGTSRGQLQRWETTGRWRPLLRGTHLVAQRRGAPLVQAWARSAALALPAAVVGLETAAVLHRSTSPAPPADTAAVHVVLPPGAERGARRGLEAHVWP